MIIPVCDRCKVQNVEGVICHHCDTTYCYECLDIHPHQMRICPVCEQFLCDECFEGLIECDGAPPRRKMLQDKNPGSKAELAY